MSGHRSNLRSSPTSAGDLGAELEAIAKMSIDALRKLWRERRGSEPPDALTKDLLARALTWQAQEAQMGGIDPATRILLRNLAKKSPGSTRWLKPGTVIVREYAGDLHEVMVMPQGFCWRGETFTSLSGLALRITGTSWDGARFFGIKGEVRAQVAVRRGTQ